MKTSIVAILAALAATGSSASLVGANNVQLGAQVGGSSGTSVYATNNVAVGAYAMWSSYDRSGIEANVAVGVSAGADTENVRRSVFVGAGAGDGASDCAECVAIGVNAGKYWQQQNGRVAVGKRIDATAGMAHFDTADLSVGRLYHDNGYDFQMENIRDPQDFAVAPWTPGTVRTGTVALETYASDSPEGLRRATLSVGDDGRLAVSLNGMVANIALETSDPALDWAAARGGIDPGDTLAIYADGSRIVTNLASIARINGYVFPTNNLVAVYGGTNCVEVGEHAFYCCDSLVVASFPAATHVGNYAFYYCFALKQAYFPVADSLGKGTDGFSDETNTFCGCISLEEIELPAATNICWGGLQGCPSLRRVYAPALKSLGSSVFYGDSSLETVDFGTSLAAVPSMGAASGFTFVPATCCVVVPDGLLAAWRTDAKWSNAASLKGFRIVSQSGYRTARRADIDDAVETAMSARLDGISFAFENGALAVYTNGAFAVSLGQ